MSLMPWHADEKVTLLLGDVATILAQMSASSIDCVVTSPPYYATRDWGDGQIGQEATPAAYLDALRAVFRQVLRVLWNDGTCWVNIADAHTAAFPPDLALRCIQAGCPPDGVTLDPFSKAHTFVQRCASRRSTFIGGAEFQDFTVGGAAAAAWADA
jgi:DNA modification methylase